MIHLHPYNLGSRSTMALKEYINGQGVRTIVSHRLASNRKRMFVGWGAKSFDFTPNTNAIINHPQNTKLLSCKKRFFNAIPEETRGFIPAFTSDPQVAISWDSDIVVRATTTGSGGAGITVVEAGNVVPQAPLFTRYQKKTHEYRLHILGGEIKEIQRKVFVKSDEKPEPDDWRIRNHTFGFIFQTEAECPAAVSEAALAVFKCFQGLDFAALDVIYHKPSNVALVLEGNTAPGLEGPRVAIYGDYLINKYKELM